MAASAQTGVKVSQASSLLTFLDTMGVSLLLPILLAVYMLDTYMVSTVQFSAVQWKAVPCSWLYRAVQ